MDGGATLAWALPALDMRQEPQQATNTNAVMWDYGARVTLSEE